MGGLLGLRMGMTLARFQALGKNPLRKRLLKSRVK